MNQQLQMQDICIKKAEEEYLNDHLQIQEI